MDEEKTLLQQIRDKEQEYSKKVETVKKETDAQVAAARTGRDLKLRDAGESGKKAADGVYFKEKQKTDSEIAHLRKTAVEDTEAAIIKGEKNLNRTVEKIIRYVTKE